MFFLYYIDFYAKPQKTNVEYDSLKQNVGKGKCVVKKGDNKA